MKKKNKFIIIFSIVAVVILSISAFVFLQKNNNKKTYNFEKSSFTVDLNEWSLKNYSEIKLLPTKDPQVLYKNGGLVLNSIKNQSTLSVSLSDEKLSLAEVNWLTQYDYRS
ncbi:MAG: hypothetical protein ABI721_03080 [Candidatus Dojkabacteria bacterium]